MSTNTAEVNATVEVDQNRTTSNPIDPPGKIACPAVDLNQT